MHPRTMSHVDFLQEIIDVLKVYTYKHVSTIRKNSNKRRDDVIAIASHVYDYAGMHINKNALKMLLLNPSNKMRYLPRVHFQRQIEREILNDFELMKQRIMQVLTNLSTGIRGNSNLRDNIESLFKTSYILALEDLTQNYLNNRTNHNISLDLPFLYDACLPTFVSFLNPQDTFNLSLTCKMLNRLDTEWIWKLQVEQHFHSSAIERIKSQLPDSSYKMMYKALANEIRVFVKELSGGEKTVFIDKNASIETFHKKTSEALESPICSFRLLFNSRQLAEGSQESLRDCNIIDYSAVHALFRLRGD